MKRHVLNLLAIVFVLLGLASAGMWVHSEFIWLRLHRAEAPDLAGNFRRLGLSSCNGRFSLCKHEHGPSMTPGPPGYTLEKAPTPADPWTWFVGRSPDGGFCLAGFYFQHQLTPGVDEMHFFSIPYYALIVFFFAWPIRRWMKSRAVAAGCCTNCGYDLRASPERCPECGMLPAGDSPKVTA